MFAQPSLSPELQEQTPGCLLQEDHMHSFFLAETCKYLFLIANDTFMRVSQSLPPVDVQVR